MGNLAGIYNHQVKLSSQYLQLHSYTVERLLGLKPDPVVAPRNDDRRFSAVDWQDVLYFDLLRQTYLIAAERVMACTEELANGGEQPGKKLLFLTQKFVDALAPSNYALANPVTETR